MFPYITVLGVKLYMTGIGIVLAFLTFLMVSGYLTKKYHQNFWKLFYSLPIIILLAYLMGSYVDFFLTSGHIIPQSYDECMTLLSPYGYKFHFVGLIIGIGIGIVRFFKQIRRYEDKKIWIDILFFSFSLSMIPLGLFLLLGDNFIGNTTNGIRGIRPLHPDSDLNKFTAVYPIGFFLSIGSLLVTIGIRIIRRIKRKYGLGAIGLAILLFITNLIFLIQQYPRYGTISFGSIIIDIKQYVSFFIIMICLHVYNKRQRE